MLQCLRHYASNAGGIGLIPWSENSYHTRCVVWQKIKKTNLKSIHPFYNFWVLTTKEIEHIFKCLMAFLFLLLWFSSVQSLRRVWLFVTPWTAARQAYLSITNSQSLLKLMSIKLVMPSNHLMKEESEKVGLKLNIQKIKIMASSPVTHFMAHRWGNNGSRERLYFWGLQNHCRWWLQPWN